MDFICRDNRFGYECVVTYRWRYSVSLLLVLLVQIVDSLLGAYWTISPWKLAIYATQWLTGSPDQRFLVEYGGYDCGYYGAMMFGVWMSKRNASKTKF